MLICIDSNAINNGFIFKHISQENNLPGLNIHSICEDRLGLMWFAIESSGLCQYDGKSFTIYEYDRNDSNSLSDNFPLCIAEDSTGFIWIGTINGLNRFDRSTNKFDRLYHTNSSNSIPSNYIKDLYVDHMNNIWIATREGVSKYNPQKNEYSNLLIGEKNYTEGLPGDVSSIYEDADHNIWIGSYSSGLFLINGENNLNHNKGIDSLQISKSWIPFIKGKKAEANYAVLDVCGYDKQKLILAKMDGLYLFDKQKEEFSRLFLEKNPELNSETVSNIHRDKSGRIWIGYANRGLIFLDDLKGDEHYFNAYVYKEGGLKSNTIREIYEDRNGLIWIGTKFRGIHIYDKRYEIFNSSMLNELIPDYLENRFILSTYEDRHHYIWVGTKYKGVFNYDKSKGKWSQFSTQGKNQYTISNNRVECIAEDYHGNMWLGTMGGILKSDKSGKNFRQMNDLYIRCIYPDVKGNVWIGTNASGIFYYNSQINKIDRYSKEQDSSILFHNNFSITTIYMDNESSMWISTENNGVFNYNFITNETLRFYSDSIDSAQLRIDGIHCFYNDNSGLLWAGTFFRGPVIFDSEIKEFKKVQPENIIFPNTVYSIIQDDHNTYWMGTNKGIIKYVQQSGKISTFGAEYGIKSTLIAKNAMCITNDNVIYMGGSEGLNVFDPKNFSLKEMRPNLIITSVKLYDEVVERDVATTSELTVDYDKKYISFDFVLTHYMNPLKVQYAYILENYDKNWINCNNNNRATYTALPPGKYTFKVKALNHNIDPVYIKLTIKAPFWQNPYFILSAILFFISSGVIIHFARLNILKKREIRLNHLVHEKTYALMELNLHLEENKSKLEEALIKAEENDKLKTMFLTNLSHEIRTPMNGILGFIDLLQNNKLESNQQQEYLNIIRKSSQRMLRIIFDLIDISKIESNQLHLVSENCNILKLIDELVDFFTLEADTKELHLEKEISLLEDESIIECDKTKVSQVISNLLINAIKYSDKSTITIGCSKLDSEILIFVRDTGKGIPHDKIEIIFERFRQIIDNDEEYREGSGLGLSISRAFVELHNGKIWVKSELNKGSTFYFTLPVKISVERMKNNLDRKIDRSVNLKNLEGKKVLIVEDDEYSYLLLQEILRNNHFQICYAKDCKEAVEKIKNDQLPDLILMDIKMPRLNGLKAAKEIKKVTEAKNKFVPIILQSAYVERFDINSKKKKYVDDFLPKPIDKKELLEIFKKYLS